MLAAAFVWANLSDDFCSRLRQANTMHCQHWEGYVAQAGNSSVSGKVGPVAGWQLWPTTCYINMGLDIDKCTSGNPSDPDIWQISQAKVRGQLPIIAKQYNKTTQKHWFRATQWCQIMIFAVVCGELYWYLGSYFNTKPTICPQLVRLQDLTRHTIASTNSSPACEAHSLTDCTAYRARCLGTQVAS